MKLRKLFAVLMTAVLLLRGAAIPRKTESSLPLRAEAVYANDRLAAYAQEVAALVNQARTENGLPPVLLSAQLCDAASLRAEEIRQSFSHTRPDGTSCFTALDAFGIRYTFAGENIASGQRTPQQVMDAWMHSEGHRANILHGRAEYLGVGVTEYGGVICWTQFFAASDTLTGREIRTEATAPAETVTTPAETVTAPAETVTAPAETVTTPAETVTTPAEEDVPDAEAIPALYCLPAALRTWLLQTAARLGLRCIPHC